MDGASLGCGGARAHASASSTSTRVVSSACSSVVRLFDGDRFLGTGFVVSESTIVTCAHVVAGASALFIELEAARGPSPRNEDALDVPTGRVHAARVYSSPTDDVTLVAASTALILPSLTLMSGLNDEILRSWSGHIAAHGYRAPFGQAVVSEHLVLRGTLLADSPSATLCTGQVDGGAPSGMSGSPLVVRHRGRWLAVGMLYLGGAQSGQTAFVAADRLLATLRSAAVEPSAAPAEARDGEPAAASTASRNASRPRRRLARALWVAAPILVAAAALAVAAPSLRPQWAVSEPEPPLPHENSRRGSAAGDRPTLNHSVDDSSRELVRSQASSGRAVVDTPPEPRRAREPGAAAAKPRRSSTPQTPTEVGTTTSAVPDSIPACPELVLLRVEGAGPHVFGCKCDGKAVTVRAYGRSEPLARENARTNLGGCDKS